MVRAPPAFAERFAGVLPGVTGVTIGYKAAKTLSLWAPLMLDLFFLNNAQPYPLLWAQHDPWLVTLSVAMAVLASVLALETAGLARSADTRFMRKMARGSGAMAMALGGGHLVDALYRHAGVHRAGARAF